MTKPFSPRELVLRVQKQLRAGTPVATSGPLQLGGISIDVSRHIVTVDGQPIDLTSTEFKLLLTLVERRGRVQSREELLRDVWEYEAGVDSRTVDTHMRRLRQKLGKLADHLETVRGFGYRLLE
jgi:two-component system phosphate regulon response regulator PhoB